MKKIILALGGLALGAGSAAAGDIERSQQSVGILFEKGRYAELSFGFVNPDVTGVIKGSPFESQGMAGNFNIASFSYKQAIGPNMDVALILDQPIGADVDYPADAFYPLAGTTAKLRSKAVTGLVRYKFENNVSVYGGLRAETVEGQANILVPGAAYLLKADGDWNLGYVVGVAWEKPEIAARVALTYNSAIDHEMSNSESINGFTPPDNPTSFETTVPQSISLEAQTGIAKDTLLFGSIRWVDWTEFVIAPPLYESLAAFGNEPIVYYDSDRITYTLGLGRKFNENWSGAVTVSYEPSNGDPTGNLGPNDGYRSIGLGATYTEGPMKITGGIRYVELGNATTRRIGARFEDNDAIAVGVRIGYSF